MNSLGEHFLVSQDEDITVVTPIVFDFLDQVTSFETKRELVHFAKTQKPTKVAVDFQHIQRFATDFIGMLLSFKRQLGAGGKIALCAMQPVHREIFRVMNLDGTVFHISDTLQEAIQWLRSDP